MDISYYLPCKPGSIYLNVTDECLNDCLFCIKRDGPVFFGSDLSLEGWNPEPAEIIDSLITFPYLSNVREIVFCGMGEPLLRYDCVLEVCVGLRELSQTGFKIRVDTSGLHWAKNKILDILDHIDILSVSLNAENSEKYQQLCQPKINVYANGCKRR